MTTTDKRLVDIISRADRVCQEISQSSEPMTDDLKAAFHRLQCVAEGKCLEEESCRTCPVDCPVKDGWGQIVR